MRVGLDLHGLTGLMQGSRTHVANLAVRLPAAAPEMDFVFYVPNPQASEARVLAGGAPNVTLRSIPAGRAARLLWPFPARAAREVDVLHCQYVAPLTPTAPCVITLHDILHESLPQYFPGGLKSLMRLLYPVSARRAAMVLTVSDFSRREIVSRYRVPEDRVAYVHSGVGEEFSPVTDPATLAAMRARLGIPDGPYILYVGRIEPRKNLPGLLAAHALLRNRLGRSAPWLVLAGGRDRLFRDFNRRMRQAGAGEGVILTGSVSQEDLPALYSGATVFAYPTFGEGFGLPVIEAMACGTPVVASTAPAVPEVAGGAALLVDPADTAGLAEALWHVVTDAALAGDLTRRGLARAGELRWEATVALCLSAYRRAAGKGRA